MENIQEKLANFRGIPGTKLYRSARPDRLEGKALADFLEMGIKTIIDLRSMREFPSASGPKALDDHYKLSAVILGKTKNVIMKSIDKQGSEISQETMDLDAYPTRGSGQRKHLIFDMVAEEYVYAVMQYTGYATRGFLGALYLTDKLFGTHHFLRALVRHCIVSRGLIGQYKDIVDYCGQKVFIVLKTMTDKNQSPFLVNCTYGKDRTGVIVALTLSVLGKSPDYIADDYSLSAAELAKRKSEFGILQQMGFTTAFNESDRDVMVQLLQHIDTKYGSIDEYLDSIGFTVEWREKLREALLLDDQDSA